MADNSVCGITENVTLRQSGGMSEYSAFSINSGNGDIFITGEINYESAVRFASLMKVMESQESNVRLYINSAGGELRSGLLMYDIIQAYPYGIDIYCTGIAASMAALLLAGGRKGHRFILPHSQVMIHEPLILDSFGGSATTIEKKAQGILRVRELVNGILAKHTGRKIEEINRATSFDNFMDAEEAVKFGICDEIRSIFKEVH